MQLTRLIYASNHGGLSKDSIDEICTQACANNVTENITGLLIITSEDFVQALEGARSAVARCFMRIVADRRHRDIVVVSVADIEERSFPDAPMACVVGGRIEKRIPEKFLVEDRFHPALLPADVIRDLCEDMSSGAYLGRKGDPGNAPM